MIICFVQYQHSSVQLVLKNGWILKNSTNLLSSLGHLGVHRATSIQTFDFSTMYTSVPHDLLKSCMNNIINNAVKHKHGATWYTQIKVGRNKSFSPAILSMVTINALTVTSAKWLNFCWIIYMSGLVNSFFDKWLPFLWENLCLIIGWLVSLFLRKLVFR